VTPLFLGRGVAVWLLPGRNVDDRLGELVGPAAVAMGKKGGKARADSLTPERRAETAKKAAAKRWQE
jgi:hypothetical protein